MNFYKWIDENTNRLDGKYVGITGSTGGLGKEICNFLGYLGANLILIDRNRKRSEEHKEILISKYNIEVLCITCDMEDIYSIDSAINYLKKYKLDYLILNAGAYKVKRHETNLGVDNLFQINNLSPYKLVKGLIDNVNHFVMVSSIAYGMAKYNQDNYDYKNKSDMKTYGNSKRFLMYSLINLASNKMIRLSIGHPGITPTNIIANYPKWLKAIIKYPMKWLFISPKKASLAIVKCMFEESLDSWYGPMIFNIWGKPGKKKIKYNSNEANKMITINESIINKNQDLGN